MKQRVAAMVLVLACLMVASPAGSAEPTPVLLYGPEGPDEAGEARALATFYLLGDQQKSAPSIRHISTSLASSLGMEILGSDGVVACPGSPVTVDPFRAGLDAALSQVLNMELDEARETLQRLDALLPCLSGVLPREELARISFLEGVGLAYFGHSTEARSSFRRALVVSPTLAWEPRFPPATQAIFKEAVEEALAAATATVDVEPLVGATGTLWLDGDPCPPGGGRLTLAEGRHLFQWQGDGGSFESHVVAVQANDHLAVLSQADVNAAAICGRGTGPALERAAVLLTQLSVETGLDHLYLAELGSVDLLHRFDATTGRWTLTDQGMVDRRLRGRRLNRAGQATLVTSGVLAVVGSVVALAGYAEGQRTLEEESSIQDPQVYEEMERQYQANRQQATAGLVMAGVGGAGVAVSIPLLVRAAGTTHPPQATDAKATAEFQLAPNAVRFSIRFE